MIGLRSLSWEGSLSCLLVVSSDWLNYCSLFIVLRPIREPITDHDIGTSQLPAKGCCSMLRVRDLKLKFQTSVTFAIKFWWSSRISITLVWMAYWTYLLLFKRVCQVKYIIWDLGIFSVYGQGVKHWSKGKYLYRAIPAMTQGFVLKNASFKSPLRTIQGYWDQYSNLDFVICIETK